MRGTIIPWLDKVRRARPGETTVKLIRICGSTFLTVSEPAPGKIQSDGVGPKEEREKVFFPNEDLVGSEPRN